MAAAPKQARSQRMAVIGGQAGREDGIQIGHALEGSRGGAIDGRAGRAGLVGESVAGVDSKRLEVHGDLSLAQRRRSLAISVSAARSPASSPAASPARSPVSRST